MNRVALVGVGTLLVSTAGCGQQDGPSGVARQNLFNASDGNAFLDSHARPQVLTVEANGSFCGGVLVASNVVLTAAHCVDANAPGPGGGESTKPFKAITGTYRIDFKANADDAPPFFFPHLAFTFPGPGTPQAPALVDVIANPDYPGLREVHDMALIILPVSSAVSRRLVVPA